ncbi:MAG: hypothetical protein QOG57_4834 [Pseudonocardiales bacterium]|nr:hypothetical protein [Pseudonocardiales bacterium]
MTKPTDPQDSTRTAAGAVNGDPEAAASPASDPAAEPARNVTGAAQGAGNGTVRPSPRPRVPRPGPTPTDAGVVPAPDAAVPEAPAPSSSSFEAPGPDSVRPDSPRPDSAVPGYPSADSADSSLSGAPVSDAPVSDASVPDTGPTSDAVFDHEAEQALADPPVTWPASAKHETASPGADPEPAAGAINGQPEAPTAALPPPWQRIPESSEPTGSDTRTWRTGDEPVEQAARPAPSPTPSPTPRPPSRPRGPRAATVASAAAAAGMATEAVQRDPAGRRPRAERTDQNDLGQARTVSLESGRLGGRAAESEATPDSDERAGPGRSPGGFPMSWPRNRRPRQASLQLKRLDPWSVLKIALVLAVVLYLIWLVAVGVLYGVLDGIGVWDRLNGQYADLVTEQAGDRLISAGRVFGAAAVIGAVNSLLFAVALSVGAFVYNVSADLVGGVEVTLSERD